MTTKEDRFEWIQRKVRENAVSKTESLLSELELMEDTVRAYDVEIHEIKRTIRYWKSKTIEAEKKIVELNEQLDELLGVVTDK